jgi:DNA modification methylase
MAFDSKVTENYAIYHGDCCKVMPELPSGSVHLSLYSPPFGGLYQYSSDPEDLSNSANYEEFFEHYTFVVKDLHRLTIPGRMTVVHCTDIFRSVSGEHTIKDFPGDIIRCHEENGWRYVARIHIWKEPLTVRNRTMLKSLHHKTLVEDSTQVSIANADYVCVFRRQGDNPIPVTHPRGLRSYAGSAEIPEEVLKWKGHKGHQINNAYSQWIWRQYASSNWHDIRIDRTLGSGASLYSHNRADKDEPDEKHMHPLQLDVIERACVLWSNPGETVLTPFMGVGSEVYGCVVNGRRGIGVELKAAYYRQAVKNLSNVADAISHDAVPLFSDADTQDTSETLDVRKHVELGGGACPVAKVVE